jgi:phosphatidylglycerol:prolipoprotein diacylglycerol transferase
VYPLLFHFGNLAIPTYGVLTAVGLLAALALAVQQAGRVGLSAEKIWTLGLVAILVALFGARLLVIGAHLRAFRAHPFWVLGLTSIEGAWVAVGGAAIGVAAAVLYALAEGLPLLRTADVVAPGVALGCAINRIGAFCGGLAWGRPTTLPWSVTYRSVVAYLWYRTPLLMRLHPVQLYDAAASLAVLGLLLWMGGRTAARRAGEIAGTCLFLYGLSRFFFEFLRGDATPALGGFLTVAQGLAMLAVIVGGALWLRRDAVLNPS